jgi:hypothetical protein
MSPVTTTMPRVLRLALTVVPVALAAGCGGDDAVAPPAGSPPPFTVSGTLAGPRLATLPADARAVVVWAAEDPVEGDIGYQWGSGTVDAASGRFSITLGDVPPTAATFSGPNGARLGVGFVALVPASEVRTGRVDEAVFLARALGAAGNHAVIYTEGPMPAGGWEARFGPGYTVGRGVPARAGETFDRFEPAAANSVQVTVDALQNIRVVNWTQAPGAAF